jgi:hypothetical protein
MRVHAAMAWLCKYMCMQLFNRGCFGCPAGGLIFGWNALALMLKAQGNYNRNCTQPIEGARLKLLLCNGRAVRCMWLTWHEAIAAAERACVPLLAADIGSQGLNTNCAWQESRLAVLWTIGVFALNFGPVIVGPILDYVGPKLTAILGLLLKPHFA